MLIPFGGLASELGSGCLPSPAALLIFSASAVQHLNATRSREDQSNYRCVQLFELKEDRDGRHFIDCIFLSAKSWAWVSPTKSHHIHRRYISFSAGQCLLDLRGFLACHIPASTFDQFQPISTILHRKHFNSIQSHSSSPKISKALTSWLAIRAMIC